MVSIPEMKKAEHYINMVVQGRITSVILVSEGGLGKSYLAVKRVKELAPNNYKYFSGHLSPLSLYKLLYQHKDSIIILDDVEELLAERTAVGILKSALWNVDGKRVVTYATTSDKAEDVPDNFEFNGGVIILCNEIPSEKNPAVKALASRTALCKIHITYKQKQDIMDNIVDEHTELSSKERAQLKEVLSETTSIATDSFNLRTVERLIAFYKYNKEVVPKEQVLFMSLFKETIEEDEVKAMVWDLMHRKLNVKKQVEQFMKQTGHSRATFFRMKKELSCEQQMDIEKVSKSQTAGDETLRHALRKKPMKKTTKENWEQAGA